MSTILKTTIKKLVHYYKLFVFNSNKPNLFKTSSGKKTPASSENPDGGRWLERASRPLSGILCRETAV